jgi:hypothetical protein
VQEEQLIHKIVRTPLKYVIAVKKFFGGSIELDPLFK